MKKFILPVLALMWIILPTVSGAETVTLNTYYPAPFGSYDRLRLVPRAGVPSCTAALEGLLYYDDTDNRLMICQTDSTWGPLTTVWTQNSSDDVFLSDTSTNPNLQVGIGTASPAYPLEIEHATHPVASFRWTDLNGRGENYFYQNSEFFGAIGAYGDNYADPKVARGLGLTSGVNSEGFLFFRTREGNKYRDRMKINNNGNIGIGTTVIPNSKVHIIGTASYNPLRIDDELNDNTPFFIDSIGRVGIGTSLPVTDVHIERAAGDFMNDPVELRLTNATEQGSSQLHLQELHPLTAPGNTDGFFVRYHSGPTGLGINNGLEFVGYSTGTGVPETAHMRIQRDNGDVGIGTGSDVPRARLHVEYQGQPGLADPAQLLLVNSAIQGSAQIVLGEDAIPDELDGFKLRYNSNASGSKNALEFVAFNDEVDYPVRMRIEWDGDGYVGIGTTDPATKLDVNGMVRIGNDSTSCTGSTAGTIRYDTGQFQGCDGSGWITFSGVGGGPNFESNWFALADHGTQTITHNLGYLPNCMLRQDHENLVVSIYNITTTAITVKGWSPGTGQTHNVKIYCW